MALFIDTQHQGLLRQVHEKADDVNYLVLELGIIRDLESRAVGKMVQAAWGYAKTRDPAFVRS